MTRPDPPRVTSGNTPSAPRPNPSTTFPNNLPIRNQPMINHLSPGQCYGCGGNGHMLGECPQMKKLVEDGTVIYDMGTCKYHMPNGSNIMCRGEETISEAAQCIQSMSFRPMGVATSNFITLNNKIQDYYRQARF